MRALVADREGRIFDHPLEAAVRTGQEDLRLPAEEWIPLPEGSTLFALPGRRPVVWEAGKGSRTVHAVMVNGARRLRAVAAFLPAGYTRTHLPAWMPGRSKTTLPLWAYTAVAWKDATGHGHGLSAAAVRTDVRDIHNPFLYPDADLLPRVRERAAEHPDNRLIRQLVRCATVYHCFAAKNFFLRRWECPLPTAPSCNAQCAGCLSAQPAGLTLPSHGRLAFSPTVEEVVQVAHPHLESIEEGIVSFGQGCEGEPLLQADLLEAVIRRLRSRTDRGTINLNTNGSLPRAVERLARAGLDAVRVSLNATEASRYAAYYEPKHYTFRAVRETIRIAKGEGLYTSINLLVFPGVTDAEEDVEGLCRLIEESGLDMIQMRNLNIDPDLYLRIIPPPRGKAIGIRPLLRLLRQRFPHVEIGYFNRPKEAFGQVLSSQLRF